MIHQYRNHEICFLVFAVCYVHQFNAFFIPLIGLKVHSFPDSVYLSNNTIIYYLYKLVKGNKKQCLLMEMIDDSLEDFFEHGNMLISSPLEQSSGLNVLSVQCMIVRYEVSPRVIRI